MTHQGMKLLSRNNFQENYMCIFVCVCARMYACIWLHLNTKWNGMPFYTGNYCYIKNMDFTASPHVQLHHLLLYNCRQMT